ncbi:copper resistance CopC family protein [Actinomadura scrupuli]|uniref:copper resistance CopC family protein n=1 Tax=Actinomadura scrupuli TaxID=559629 RepID=UPI003D9971E6
MRDRSVRIAVVTAGAALAFAATTGPVSAHTSLKAASPAIGSTVAPPSTLALTFADPVRFPQVVLLDAAGGRHESGTARAVDNVVTQPVGGTLAPGPYTVGWRVVALDGHPVSGKYRFTVKGGTGPAGSASGPVAGPAPSGGPPAAAPAAGSSGTGWWWIGLAALLAGGSIAGIVIARRSAEPGDGA